MNIARLASRVVPPLKKSRIPLSTTYDYVIIGAGSAGCILANELSKCGQNTVLLLEAGGWDMNPLIHIPAGVYSVFKDESINWNYKSEPEPHAGGRCIELPRGKVIGGSSAINAMVYMRGIPQDYDRWSNEHNLSEWTYADCLPYFKKCETSDRGSSDYRGGTGRLQVTKGNMQNPLYEAFLEAGETSGQGTSDDLNGHKPEGLARLDRTASPDGRRCSSADAHLMPALGRDNLELTTGATVSRLLLDGKRVLGVEIGSGSGSSGSSGRSGNSGGHRIEASKEVIVCAGAIKSPQLLLLSGIGPLEHLQDVGIECLHELNGVGQNLQDHACIVTQYHSTLETVHHSLSHLSKPHHKMAAGAQWLLNGSGAASSNIWEGGGLVYGKGYRERLESERRSESDSESTGSSEIMVDGPNLQYHFCPVFSDYDENAELTLYPGFQMQIDCLRPASRGSVTLQSSNPYDAPKSLFNYFQKEEDLMELVDGLEMATEILHQPSFDKYRGRAGMPSSELVDVMRGGGGSTEKLREWVRENSGTDYHPCGTCRMSGNENDNGAVLDSEMRVRGLQGVRVVDASVMPNIVSGNLNAPTQMIAMKGADMILGRVPLEKERPKFHFENAV